MSNTLEHFDDEEEITDNGFEDALGRLGKGDFNQIQAIRLIERARQLALENPVRLQKLRQLLIRMFGTNVGDLSRVVLNFLDERDQSVILFI